MNVAGVAWDGLTTDLVGGWIEKMATVVDWWEGVRACATNCGGGEGEQMVLLVSSSTGQPRSGECALEDPVEVICGGEVGGGGRGFDGGGSGFVRSGRSR